MRCRQKIALVCLRIITLQWINYSVGFCRALSVHICTLVYFFTVDIRLEHSYSMIRPPPLRMLQADWLLAPHVEEFQFDGVTGLPHQITQWSHMVRLRFGQKIPKNSSICSVNVHQILDDDHY